MNRRQVLALAGAGGVAGLAGCIDRIAGLQSRDLRAETPEEAVETFWNAVVEEDRDAIVAVTEGISDLYFEVIDVDDYDEFMEQEVEPISDWELLQVDGDLTLAEIVENKLQPPNAEDSIQDFKNRAEQTADEVGATDHGFVYVKLDTKVDSTGQVNVSPIEESMEYAYKVDGYWYQGPAVTGDYSDDEDR